MKNKLAAIYIMVSVFVTSCATTDVTGIWKDDTYTGKPIDKVMVIGIFNKDYVRRKLEDEFVKQFQNKNINAVASFRSIPSDKLLNKNELLQKLKGSGSDFILISRVVEKKKEEYYEPGTTYIVPDGYYYNWHNYYSRTYGYVHRPGYVPVYEIETRPPIKREYEIYIVETNLYEIKSDKLVMSIMSETYASLPVDKVITRFARTVFKSLAKNNMIGR